MGLLDHGEHRAFMYRQPYIVKKPPERCFMATRMSFSSFGSYSNVKLSTACLVKSCDVRERCAIAPTVL